MQSKTNIFVLLIAMLAFLPVLLIGHFLDGHIRARETPLLLQAASSVSGEAQTAVYEALDTLSDVLMASPSLCTNSFLNSLSRRMQSSAYVRQVLVENNLGVRYCEALGGGVDYEVLSDELSIPGRVETVAAVRIPGVDVPGLRITRKIDRNKHISAFVTFGHVLATDSLPVGLRNVSMLRISFTDGTELFTLGDSSGFDEGTEKDRHITAIAFAGDIPLRIEVAVPFAVVKMGYAELYIWLTLLACVISAAILMGSINTIRKSSLPSFDLEQAIENGDIRPFYQPIIDITTGRMYGCEVLARWVKKNGEIISPAAFIEYAEVTGLAVPMTISLMEAVRKDLGEISALNPKLRISINLFEGHFRDGSVVEDIIAIFSDSQISYRQLVFEITERHPLGDDEQAKRVINGLHSLGCRLAMDDVGTGHSNLAYIQTLGVDIIKIDRVFVDPITDETQSAPVLDSLINMATELEAGIIAEGVETEAQAMYLRARGVKNVQGFLFSPAISAEKYIEMVHTLNPSQTVEQGDKNKNLFAA